MKNMPKLPVWKVVAIAAAITVAAATVELFGFNCVLLVRIFIVASGILRHVNLGIKPLKGDVFP